MAKVEIGKGRSQIEETASGLQITIPAKKNYFLILFLAFWLMGWVFGEFNAIVQLFSSGNEKSNFFLFAWLGGWTLGGAFAIYTWLWNLKGQEIINFSNEELQYIRRLPIFQKSNEYDLTSISNLRVEAQNNSLFGSRNGMEFWGISGGAIVFDYGHSTHKFGAQLDDAEAQYIVNTIKQRYKNL